MKTEQSQHDYWIDRVLEKIGLLLKLGADFKHTYWLFDWDKALPESKNIENYANESRALIFISATGALGIESSKPKTHERRYPQLNEHEGDLPLSVDIAGQNGVGSVWYRAYWITSLDYEKYLQLCESYSGGGTNRTRQTKAKDEQSLNVNDLKVDSTSYDSTNRMLNLAGHIVPITRQRDRKSETQEAKLMRLLFSVKHFSSGVGISNLYPVKDYQNAREQRKKARALVTAINKKLPDELKGQELIKFDSVKFYINPTYLKR